MQYRAAITIDVEGAEAEEADYLHRKAGEIGEYLGFEGEDVAVSVSLDVIDEAS